MNVSYQEGQRVILNSSYATLRSGTIASYLGAIQAGLLGYRAWQVIYDNGVVETHTEAELDTFQATGQLTIIG